MQLSSFAEVSKKNSQFIAKYWLLGEDDPLSKRILETMTGGNSEEIKQLLKDEADIDLDKVVSPLRVNVTVKTMESGEPEKSTGNLEEISMEQDTITVSIPFIAKKPDGLKDDLLVKWVTDDNEDSIYPNYAYRASSSS